MSDPAPALVLLQPYLLGIAAVVLVIASLADIAARTIPDLASLGLLVIGVVVRHADHNTVAALAASASVFLFGACCWRFGWLGGGDVKLLAACAFLVPPILVPQLVLLTALAGGVLALVYLTLGRVAVASHSRMSAQRPRSLAVRIARAEWWRIRRRAALPYGCAIAAATLLTLTGR